MTNLVTVNGNLIVEAVDKQNRRSAKDPFGGQLSSNNSGVVKFSNHPDYPVGTQVYFYGNLEKILVDGNEILAMKVDNIIAKVEEPSNEHS